MIIIMAVKNLISALSGNGAGSNAKDAIRREFLP